MRLEGREDDKNMETSSLRRPLTMNLNADRNGQGDLLLSVMNLETSTTVEMTKDYGLLNSKYNDLRDLNADWHEQDDLNTEQIFYLRVLNY